MSIILAIESSTELASVALYLGAAGSNSQPRLASRQVSGVQAHSLTILPMVQALLAEAGIGLRQCDAIAFGAGPGSFTGVRTACGIAQGLAYGTDLPVLMVDTLMAMALVCRNDGAAAEVQPALDARMGELYWARYRWAAADAADTDADGLPEVVVAPRLALPANVDLDPQIKRCGNGYSAHGNHFATVLGSTNFYAAIMPHALQVARLGAALLARGAAVAARDARPFYLRNNVALTTAERLGRVDLNRTTASAAQADVGKHEDTVALTALDTAPAATP